MLGRSRHLRGWRWPVRCGIEGIHGTAQRGDFDAGVPGECVVRRLAGARWVRPHRRRCFGQSVALGGSLVLITVESLAVTGRLAREVSPVRAAAPDFAHALRANWGGEGWRMLRTRAGALRQPEPRPHVTPLIPVATNSAAALRPKSLPKGWPARVGIPIFARLAQPRPPQRLIVAGAHGGAGTTTVTALLADTAAAASHAPAIAVDQSGLPWAATLAMRLLGERAGLPAAAARRLIDQGAATAQARAGAPCSGAGTMVVDDVDGYTPLPVLIALAAEPSGTTVVDGGRVDLALAVRLAEAQWPLILVGRADLAGAQAVCAALTFLQRRLPAPPLVVLSSTAPSDRRRIYAARTLVRAAGVTTLVHLPFDATLASGQALRLDQVGRSTAGACLQLVERVGTPGEVGDPVRISRTGPPGGPLPGAANPSATPGWPRFWKHRS